jgi:acyl dehydratase
MKADEPSPIEDWPITGANFGPWDYGPFGTPEVVRYAAASGDDNPLHLDGAIAKAAGLDAPPVQGMLMLSCLEPAVRRWREDLRMEKLAAKFLRPVLAGESIAVSGRVVKSNASPGPELILRLTIRRADGEIAVLAEATAILPSMIASA